MCTSGKVLAVLVIRLSEDLRIAVAMANISFRRFARTSKIATRKTKNPTDTQTSDTQRLHRALHEPRREVFLECERPSLLGGGPPCAPVLPEKTPRTPLDGQGIQKEPNLDATSQPVRETRRNNIKNRNEKLVDIWLFEPLLVREEGMRRGRINPKQNQRKDLKVVDNGDEGDEASEESKDSRLKAQIYYGEDYGEHYDYYIGIGSWGTEKTEQETISDSNFRVLNYLESGSAVSVLEDLYQEILILKSVIGAPVVSSWDFEYRTPAERFSGTGTPKKIFPEVDSTPLLTTPLKLQRDRQFIENALRETLSTLLEDGTFEPLYEAGQILNRKYRDEENLVQEAKNNVVYMKELAERVNEKNRLDDLEERQRDELLYKLQDEIDDISLKCMVGEQFVEKWEQTRNKQNKWRLKKEEDFFRNQILDLETKSRLEKRVNEEMQLFIKGNQLELEEQLEEWMTRYDTELEKRENKILQLKYMRDQTEEEVKRLEQLYAARNVEMKEWITFREVRKRRTSATLVIQSWWRGLMVRKKLGPYKEKKQKDKKK